MNRGDTFFDIAAVACMVLAAAFALPLGIVLVAVGWLPRHRPYRLRHRQRAVEKFPD